MKALTARTQFKAAASAKPQRFIRLAWQAWANPGATAWLVAIAWLAVLPPVQASDSLLEQAIAEYSSAVDTTNRDARIEAFSRAEQLFEQAAQEQLGKTGQINSELLVNLGNAALQAEHIGRAIGAFRQSLQQNPRNQQALQNLQAARNAVPEPFRKSETFQFVDTLFFWKSQASREQLWQWAGLCFLVACVFMAVGVLRRTAWLRTLAIIPAMAWLVIVASNLLDRTQPGSEAVVQTDEAWLYSADSENSPLRLSDPLPDGTELTLLENRGRWCEVQVAARTGWLRTSALLLLSADAQSSFPSL